MHDQRHSLAKTETDLSCKEKLVGNFYKLKISRFFATHDVSCGGMTQRSIFD